MTDVKKFFQGLRNRGFEVNDDFFAYMSLVPHHRKKPNGDHNIISSLRVADFGGSNVSEGKLGCVTFVYAGSIRKKHQRVYLSTTSQEVIKKAFCPKSVQEALDTFEIWKRVSQEEMESWEFIL